MPRLRRSHADTQRHLGRQKSGMRLLDLFCGAGGAGMGYHRAGFEVVGVDIAKQPHYPFEFHQADALEFPLDGFDVIHASPPCQAWTPLNKMWNAKQHQDCITPLRRRLIEWGGLYVIENVRAAPLNAGTMLCGTMFGLGSGDAELRRHRYFETNWTVGLVPPCLHGYRPRVIGVYGGHGRDRRRKTNTQDFSTNRRREAMGIHWMNGQELSEAIPPAYTQFIGEQLLSRVAASA